MKKQLSIINSQDGFFLPYVLFIISLIFILTTSNIAIYRNDLQITAAQTEQIKIETLFQMGRTKFKANIDQYNAKNNTASYSFPDGNVQIIIHSINDNKYDLYFTILTKEKNTKYVITNSLQIGEESY